MKEWGGDWILIITGFASPVLTATGFVEEGREGDFWPPTESTPVDRSSKNLLLVITSATSTAVPNLVQIRPQGASIIIIIKGIYIAQVRNGHICAMPAEMAVWLRSVSVSSRRMGEILRKFIYTFFRELTYRSDPSTDFHAYGSNNADWRKGVPFGGFVDIVPNFGVKSPRNPNFGGTNRRFQAKRENYWKFHTTKTTSSISTKFCTICVPTNPRWWTAAILEKPLNGDMSATTEKSFIWLNLTYY